MGDRAAFQLYVYDCPVEQVGQVLDIIQTHGLDREWGALPGDAESLHLGEAYTDNEASLSIVDDVTSDLMTKAPGASWQCWQDPKYEYSGQTAMFDPELGLFEASSDSQGTPVFNGEHIKNWLEHEAPTTTVEEFLTESWKKRTGRAWEERHAALQQRYDKGVLSR